jgi:hypothetical protein
LWWDTTEEWDELPKKKYFAAVSSDLQKRIDDWKKVLDSKEAKAEKCEAKKSALWKWNQTKEEEYNGHQDSLDAEDERLVREDEFEFELDMEWARKKGGKLGKELGHEALELREKALDRMCEAQRQIKLGRLRRCRKFLERERCPLFLEEYGSKKLAGLRYRAVCSDVMEACSSCSSVLSVLSCSSCSFVLSVSSVLSVLSLLSPVSSFLPVLPIRAH